MVAEDLEEGATVVDAAEAERGITALAGVSGRLNARRSHASINGVLTMTRSNPAR